MIRLKSDQEPLTMGCEANTFLTDASDLGLPPGYFPFTIKIDDQLLLRVAVDEQCAGYRSIVEGDAGFVLEIYND